MCYLVSGNTYGTDRRIPIRRTFAIAMREYTEDKMKGLKYIAAVVALVTSALLAHPLPAHCRAAGGGAPAGEDRVLIVDTDMGLDDARAIFALLGSRGIEIAAFCTVEGSASRVKAADNVIGLIESAEAAPVTVYRGFPGSSKEPPPWREHAEGLGGHPFPPPRALSHSPLADIASRPDLLPDGVWLALGPLTNLAGLERRDPGSLRDMEVWMPVSLDGKAVNGWNFGYDPEAARLVMETAGTIILVDVSWEGDPGRLLRDVEGNTQAARWITATIRGETGTHVFLFDEIAAAAVAAPELFDVGRETFEPVARADGGFSLKESDSGRIRIVRLKKNADLERYLHGVWEAPGMEHEDHAHHMPAAGDVLALIRNFHGHLGPFVVLGYRMGRLALDETGSSGHFGISAEVHSALEPPRSCLIDGVQLGSGCTLGKRNISVESFDGPPFAVFRTAGGATVTIRLLPDILAMVKESVDSEGVEQAGMKFWEMDERELFEIIVDR